MKKTIIIIFLVLFLICINLFGYKTYRIWFEKNYLQLSSLVYVYDGTISEIRLDSGTVSEKPFSERNIDINSTNLLTFENDIYLFQRGKWKKILSTEYKISEKPVIINDDIYFVAPEPNDDSEYPNEYIWIYQNGAIKKFHQKPIESSSAILAYEKYVIFCEQRGWAKSVIIQKDVISGDEKQLASGKNICWKIEGEEIFYAPLKSGLSVLNLKTGESKILNERIKLLASPVYNSNENVLYVYGDDPKSQFANMAYISGFYYIDSDKYISCYSYFKFLGFSFDEQMLPNSSDIYWN